VKYASREELLNDVACEYQLLLAALDGLSAEQQLEAGVWGDGWNVRDLLAHLHEWHQLFFSWWQAGQQGAAPAMPAPGYKWSETPRLNRDIQQRFAAGDVFDMRTRFESSHHKVMELAESLTPAQLMDPGHFAWTGRNALVTYLSANTSSHYRFARKVLARWLRQRDR
jgi:hypothetical protein